MNKKQIELEVRGLIGTDEISEIETSLRRFGYKLVSSTRRTMVTSYGEAYARGTNWDRGTHGQVSMSCRITNGKAEIVTKIGDIHATDRKEISISLSEKDLFQFAQMVGSLPFYTKAASRRTKNYKKGLITVSLVQSKTGIGYFELEKMSDAKNKTKDFAQLKQLAKDLQVAPFKKPEEFYELCDELDRREDWAFDGSEAAIKKLKQEIKKNGSALATL